MSTIELSGLGDYSEDAAGLRELRHAAKRHGLDLRPGYYDWTLTGDREAVEALTLELWNMPADEWSENGLQVTEQEDEETSE